VVEQPRQPSTAAPTGGSENGHATTGESKSMYDTSPIHGDCCLRTAFFPSVNAWAARQQQQQQQQQEASSRDGYDSNRNGPSSRGWGGGSHYPEPHGYRSSYGDYGGKKIITSVIEGNSS